MKDNLRKVIVWILTLEARAVIRKYRPKIVLVTGSVGKTSTKDALYAALSPHAFVRKSEKSYNADIGVPLTVLGVPSGWSNPVQWLRNIVDGLILLLIRAPYPEWLIMEVGADRPGEISRSLAWVEPLVVVATRFPAVPVHVEFYETPEEVQAEELAPLSWLRPGGVAVVNADDEVVAAASVPDGVERVSFGFTGSPTYKISRFKTLTDDGRSRGVSFDIAHGHERTHVTLTGVVGAAHAYAAAAGVAAAASVGAPLASVAAAFETYASPPGRMRLIEGVRGSLLIDDTYNASPVAVEEALGTLALLPHKGKRVAVLGDMLELGAYSVSEHEKAGKYAAECVDLLVTVGMRARKIADGARAAGMPEERILQFDRALDAAEHLVGVVEAGDIVLIKGSQGMRMERATKELMAHPEDAKKQLCRQDAEWLTR